MTLILGVNAHHADAAACVIQDGVVRAAAEEERFRRVKHWSGAPTEAAAFCLQSVGARLSDVDVLAVNRNPMAGLWRKAAYVLAARPGASLLRERARNGAAAADPLRLWLRAGDGSKGGARPRLRRVEHHLAHLASAFYGSPHDSATVMSIDGFGDFASAMWARGRGARLEPLGRVSFPHSLGLFYQAITQFLGFWRYGDEYKVMGLSAYGAPRLTDELGRLVQAAADGAYRLDLSYFRHQRAAIAQTGADGAPDFAPLFTDKLAALLGPPRAAGAPIEARHQDIAASAQAVYEAALFRLLRRAQAQTGDKALCLAGGCAMNSLANGKILANTPFETLYVPPAAGDAGGAVGAAYVAHHAEPGASRAAPTPHAYLGPSYGPDALAAALSVARGAPDCEISRASDPAALVRRVAEALAEGRVVGWFQGAMEWGPRALGARSILADPRRADMQEILNHKIKRRESFRPFAPSVLADHVGAWFETGEAAPADAAAFSPFMERVAVVRPDKRARIPAVAHVDGTARLQSVDPAAAPLYASVIEAFAALTGTPMVLNTSFNENEPIVCAPQEAVACFLRTRMDLLVLGDWLVARSERAQRGSAVAAEAAA